jgi:isoleucyl-tRNA synthetase
MHQTTTKYHEAMADYDVQQVTLVLEEFIEDLTNGYIRNSRRRFWKQDNTEDKFSAYSTLYHVLMTLTKLFAPVLPFLAEFMYQCLHKKNSNSSVHLTMLPSPQEYDEEILLDFQTFLDLTQLGLSARSQAKMKLRQPLAKVVLSQNPWTNHKKDFTNLLKTSLNVKELHFKNIKQDGNNNDKWVVTENHTHKLALNVKLTDKLRQEGLIREIVRRVQVLRKKHDYEIDDEIVLYYSTKDKEILQSIETYASYLKTETLTKELVKSENVKESSSYELSKGQNLLLGLQKA